MQSKSDSPGGLPEPDAQSAQHSRHVAEHIRKQIERSGGSISFAEYMQHAMYAPGLGYYSAGATKLGAEGDFITAPEISPVFGRVVARQCAMVLNQIGGGEVFEMGAGTGALAVSVLIKLDEMGALPERYLILEVSADLRDRQEARIRRDCPQFLDRVVWIAEIPTVFTGVVLANEVADALPVERFRVAEREILQARVMASGPNFTWHYQRAPELLVAAVREIEAEIGTTLCDGYESEVSPGLAHWITELARSVKEGVILLVDYGVSRREYYAAERRQGWLRCHYRHHAHNDPLILPGIQDLTAWVDFSLVAKAASATGMQVAGYVTQAHFLIGGGLDDELSDFTSLPVAQQIELSGQVKLLTLPAEMGENFKFMGLQRGDFPPPPALSGTDKAHLL